MRRFRLAPRSVLLVSVLLVATVTSTVAVAATGHKATVAMAASTGPAPVLDHDYFVIPDAGPIKGSKIEVVEVFGFGCPICARLQPRLVDWEKTLPRDVHFSYLPAAFGDDPEHCWDDFARAFFAAQAMGIQTKSHDSIYKAKFEQGRIETCAAIPAAYADYGADPRVFASTMHSFPVNAQMTAAHAQAVAWGVTGTPTIVVDGAYRVELTRSGGPEAMLHAVDWLIAKQRPLHGRHRASHPEKR